MNHSVKFLSTLLVVQIALVAFFSVSTDSLDAFKPSERLFNLEVDAVTKVSIKDKEGTEMVLEKQQDQWVLPEYQNFPLSTKKLDTVVRGILTSMRSYPVATQKSSHRQLKVTNDDYERRIVFTGSDKDLAEVLVGSSPSFKKVHIRKADEDLVYVTKFNAFDAGVKADFWYDKEALKFKQEQVKSLSFGNITIQKVEDKFVLTGVEETKEQIDTEVNSLAKRLIGQSYIENLGVDVEQTVKDLKEVLSFEVELNDSQKYSFTFSGPYEDDYYVLKSTKYPQHFKVAKAELEALQAIEASQLVKDKALETTEANSTELQEQASEAS